MLRKPLGPHSRRPPRVLSYLFLLLFTLNGCDSSTPETCAPLDGDSIFPFESGAQWSFSEHESASGPYFGSVTRTGQATWTFSGLFCNEACYCTGRIQHSGSGTQTSRSLDGVETTESYQEDTPILFTRSPPTEGWPIPRIGLSGILETEIEAPTGLATVFSDGGGTYRERVWLTRSAGVDSLLRTTRPGSEGGGYQAYALRRLDSQSPAAAVAHGRHR